MIEGDTGVISARVVPAGSPVTWSSSDESVATVNNGTVMAIAAGPAIITGTITVDGVDYSDTCVVEVEAAPIEWESMRDYTALDVWNNEQYWIQQYYIEDTRKTYISYADGALDLVLNPDASSSTTLYADIRPSLDGLEFDAEAYDYALKLSFSNPQDSQTHPILSLTHAEANRLIDDGWSPFNIPFTSDEDEIMLPLIARSSGDRAFTMQIKHDGNDGGNLARKWIKFELMRKLKQ